MNKNFRALLALLLLCGYAMAGVGCSLPRSPVIPYYGLAYNGTTAPVDVTPGGVNPQGSVTGSSKAANVLGLFSWGDASAHTAAQNGNLAAIDGIETRMFNVLFIYQEYELTAWGPPTN